MPEHHIYYPVKELRIDLYKKDACSESINSFNTLQEFKFFLQENPGIVRLLKEGLGSQPEAPMHNDIDLETRI